LPGSLPQEIRPPPQIKAGCLCYLYKGRIHLIDYVLTVLTCSNLTYPDPPFWYELMENYAAHGFIGAAIALCPSRAGRAVFLALFALKEAAFDFANDPRLPVVLDSAADLGAMLVATQIVLIARRRRSEGAAP
jgi:hypothetical protein